MNFPNAFLCISLLLSSSALPAAETLMPSDWDATLAGTKVMAGLIQVTAPHVKGAHDAAMTLVDGHAFIVAEVNDLEAGESADRPEIYCALSIVNLKSLSVEAVIPFASGRQSFENVTLPEGACFVPRILQKDSSTLRCYFASEQPGKRQAQTWYRDFDLKSRTFSPTIHRTKLKTSAGVFDMQPRYFHEDAVRSGFAKPAKDFGMYIFDSFKVFDGKRYVALNNFPGKQNALAVLHDDFVTFEILGHYNEPATQQLSESAVNRLPDGSWMAICRADGGDRNYRFTTSKNAIDWAVAEELPFVPSGWNSKPIFERFEGTYYLGWQDSAMINGVNRSVFNIDVSQDGKTWTRKYRFETPSSFQYPVLSSHADAIWLSVTQGDSSPSRKERIMFGKLEDL